MLEMNARKRGREKLWLSVVSSVWLATGWTGNTVQAQTDSTPKDMAKITERQAVALAEAFIVQQGYTDLPADKTRMARESLERTADTDRSLKLRHNTLEPKAFGITGPADDKTSSGWIVIFRYKNRTSTSSTGRAVMMDDYGKRLRVIHQDILLTAATKRF